MNGALDGFPEVMNDYKIKKVIKKNIWLGYLWKAEGSGQSFDSGNTSFCKVTKIRASEFLSGMIICWSNFEFPVRN